MNKIRRSSGRIPKRSGQKCEQTAGVELKSTETRGFLSRCPEMPEAVFLLFATGMLCPNEPLDVP